MSAIASLFLPDAQSTPVTHEFKHRSHSATSIVLFDPASQGTVSMSRLPSKNKAVKKYRLNIKLPLFETVTGNNAEGYVAAPRIVGYDEAVCDFMIHTRSSTQLKLDLRSYVKTVLGHSDGTMWYDLLISDLMPF